MNKRPIYQLRPAEVFETLETSAGGLSSASAEERLALFGLNLLSEEIRPSVVHRLVQHIRHPIPVALMVISLLVLPLNEYFLSAAIWLLILINAGFSFWRTYSAEQAMDALRRLLPEYTRVLRDGLEESVPASQLAPGDVLILAEGDNIPADARVIEEYGLRTNNATLTGDAVPARKTADASFQEGISELERPNLVFAGTSVVSGTGRAVVFSTGMLTQFGRIAHLTQTVRESATPIQEELHLLLRKIVIITAVLAGLVLVVGYTELNLQLSETFVLAVGIAVAAIPEGLQATLTLALAMAGKRMAERGVLVKKLSVLETLGTISTICTDKSGTLTQNQMTVREVWVAGETLHVSGVGYAPVGSFRPDPQGEAYENDVRQLLNAVLLCNNARLNPPAPGKPQWSYLGDQTEAALQVAALKGGIDEAAVRKEMPRVHELPFDARRKRMTTVHQTLSDWQCLADGSPDAPVNTPAFFPRVALVKGGPREVLQLCSHILVHGQAERLTNARRAEIVAALDDYAGRALRVLGVARRCLPGTSRAYTVENVENSLTFLGLLAMHDPPRPGVSEAIQTLRQAGIRLVMITGDYGLTALSLARRVGMLVSPNARIVTGAELDQMNEIELAGLLQQPELLFARMAPEHKLRLVSAIQEGGEVVAVTGDGVNDAPALRRADVGISMGLTGTDVSKEAADIILIHDDFAAVVDAISEGRTLYDNLRKFITYIFSSNVPEVLPFMLSMMLHIPLALRVPQILAIDLGTDILPALGLGAERPEPDVMQRQPRRRTYPLVTNGLLWRAFLWLGMIEAMLCYSGFVLVYFLADRMALLSPRLAGFSPPAGLPLDMSSLPALSDGDVYRLAVTIFYAGVVMAQVGNAFACRAEINRSSTLGWLSNRWLLLGVAVSVLLLVIVVYVPGINTIFEHVSLPLWAWLWITPYGLILYSIEWVRKAVYRKFGRGYEHLSPEYAEKERLLPDTKKEAL